MKCSLCNEEVQPRTACHRIAGWEMPRSFDSARRGGSDISQRERTGEVAHAHCVDRLKHGISPAQESLI
jgi:hypothetical protein